MGRRITHLCRLAALLLLALWGTAALAQDLPARFTVTGVGAGDALNVRSEPSASARIVATLPPGSTGVEVLSPLPGRTLGPDAATARGRAGSPCATSPARRRPEPPCPARSFAGGPSPSGR